MTRFQWNPRGARVLLVPALLLAAIAACDDLAGLGDRESVSMSFVVPVAAPGASVVRAAIVSGNDHTLDLTNADLTVEDLRLDGQGSDDGDSDSEAGDSDGDTDSDGQITDDDAEFRTGPLTIELGLDGGVITPLDRQIPVGTYDELEAELAFLRLRGTYDGAPFDVTLQLDREMEIAIDPPLVVTRGDEGQNITFAVDILPCFRAADGTPIDPRLLGTDATVRAGFNACLAQALHAFEDHDRDGDEADSDTDH